VAKYWADALQAQTSDSAIATEFKPLAAALKAGEDAIMKDLIDCQVGFITFVWSVNHYLPSNNHSLKRAIHCQVGFITFVWSVNHYLPSNTHSLKRAIHFMPSLLFSSIVLLFHAKPQDIGGYYPALMRLFLPFITFVTKLL
jgi:hypothetical protein